MCYYLNVHFQRQRVKAAERASPVQSWPAQLFSSHVPEHCRKAQLTVVSVANSGRSTREPQKESALVSVGLDPVTYVQLYTARKMETCKQPPTCRPFEWRLSLDLHYCFEFRCPGFISCLWVSLLWQEAFQIFHSLHTNAEITPKIRPRPLPSAFFPIHYSLIIQPHYAVRGNEHILIKYVRCLFNDTLGSPDYTYTMTGWLVCGVRILKDVVLSRNFPRETD